MYEDKSFLDDKFKQAFESLKTPEKKFNFFDITPPKEMLLSNWLAFIFNPTINGIGNITIEKLLKSVNYFINLDDLDYIDTYTELSTDKNRRMDIVIKYKGLWIVIENKINSIENNDQTKKYYDYIESIKENNEVIYLYLKPNYNSSVPKEEHFKIITYNELINSLKEISEFDYKEPEKYKYLKEFIISGEIFMNNEELEVTESLKFYIKNIDKFEAITDEYNKKNKKLFEMIQKEILDYLNNISEGYTSYKNYNFIQFFKKNWINERHMGIHYEILFNSKKLLGNVVSAQVVLHIEDDIDEVTLNKLQSKGIFKVKTTGLDIAKNSEIRYRIKADFSSDRDIKKTIDNFKDKINKLQKEYEIKIDQVLKK